MKNFMLTIACASALMGCGPKWLPKPTQEEAAKIVDQTEASFLSGDPVRIMEHYTSDAVFFDPEQNMPTRDRAVATKWTESFVATRPKSFSPGERVLQILGDHTFISSGVATVEMTGPKGLETARIRYTDVYRQQPDRIWLIVHEHLSKLPAPEEKPGA